MSYYITHSSNFEKTAPRETLLYMLHKDQDYTELSITIGAQSNDEKISEKFKTTKRQVDIYPTENTKKFIFTTSISRFEDWVVISGTLDSPGIKLIPKQSNKLEAAVDFEHFQVKPVISARNEKTQALFNNNVSKDYDSWSYLHTGFKLFLIPDLIRNPLSEKDTELKLLGITRSGFWSAIDINDQKNNKEIKDQKNKEITISKPDSCLEKSEPLEPGFKNLSVIAGQVVCSGNSRCLFRKNLVS